MLWQEPPDFSDHRLMPNNLRSYPPLDSMIDGYDFAAPITFDAEYGWLASGQFPKECIEDCSASGSVDVAVDYWQRRLNFNPPRHLMVRYLKEYGAWEDLHTTDDDTLARRVLWTACCDIREQGEWFGLVH
jgi:hypothetical protein